MATRYWHTFFEKENMNNIKIVSFVLLCLLFLGCDSKKNDELNKEISQLNIEKSALEKENYELKKIITEYEKKLEQNKPENTDSNLDGTACFDLVAINYNEPEESIFSTGDLFLIFKNYKTEYGVHLYKILDHSMAITKIEKLSDNIVEQGDVFIVHTFLPGGGTNYKFTFEDGKLLKNAMDLPEGNFDSIPEYYLEDTYTLENISKVRLDNITIIK